MKANHNRMVGLRPEDEVLLCCACIRLEPEKAQRLKILVQPGLDWDYLLQAASRHAVAPLLYRNLKGVASAPVPGDIGKRLEEQCRANTAWNLLLTSELTKILALLEAQGIAAVPFKGPALAAFVYGGISLRQFVDLDLFLRREDLPLAKRLLVPRGYEPEISLSESREQAYLKSQYHSIMVNRATGVQVELHWEFTPRYLHFPLGSTGLWDRLERRSLAGREVLDFSPEDLLLILCVHGAEHCWERLGWICDVAELIAHREISWSKVFGLAKKLGCELMLSLGVFLAADLLGASLPDDLLQRLQKDRVVKSLACHVQRNLFSQTNFFSDASFQLRARERLRNKLGYAFYLPFTPTISDWMWISLPPSLSFFYYFIRPIRLAMKHWFRLKSIP
jgi:hypothetical protein